MLHLKTKLAKYQHLIIRWHKQANLGATNLCRLLSSGSLPAVMILIRLHNPDNQQARPSGKLLSSPATTHNLFPRQDNSSAMNTYKHSL